MTQSPLTDRVYLTSESSPRTRRIDRFIPHHGATTSLANILALFQPGGRQVSANYAIGNDGELVLAVDEDRRAWTSGTAEWDGRAITVEVANSLAADPWPVSDAAFDKLARLIADVSIRYGFPINDDTIITHQELYRRYKVSYPTACPGDIQRRKPELLALANAYRTSHTAGGDVRPIRPNQGDDDMSIIYKSKSASVDGVIPADFSFAQGGDGVLRPLSSQEFNAYMFWNEERDHGEGLQKEPIPVRVVEWEGDDILELARANGLREWEGGKDVPHIRGGWWPQLTGAVIFPGRDES